MDDAAGTWRDLDLPLLGAVLALVVFGATVVFSASFDALHARPSATFVQQVFYVLAGLLVMALFTLLDYRLLSRHAAPIYVAGITALIVVRLLGHSALGAQRWIQVGPAEIQPSEFAKLVVIVALARYFSARRERMHRWGTFIAGMALVLLPLTLVLLQPDLGTAIVFGALFLVLAWSGGAPARMLLTTAITALLAVPAAWPFLHAYQRQRILVFLDPSNRDPLTNGYNLLQAQIAIGSGGVSGKGFLLGTQGHLRFLPAPTTDFIFAVFSEEFGFIGAGVLLFLFSWLIWRLVRGSSLARDDFGGLLLMGVAGMFFFQAAVNVGMNLGVLPVVGIPLPFMSFGGSAMVTNLAAIGIAQSVLIRRKPVRF